MTNVQQTDNKAPKVALFVTCLVDLFRPSVAFACIRLLEAAGCKVEVPSLQTCCGQPAYNAGHKHDTQAVAQAMIATFEGADYVVAPSGSCIGMLKLHYPKLLASDAEWQKRAISLANRCYEITSFLSDVMDYRPPKWSGDTDSATYHDGCAGLRELGIGPQGRALLQAQGVVDITEMEDTNVCCGFGGTFCVKLPEIATRMADDKLDNAKKTDAQNLLATDLGCLLHLAGRASRRGDELHCRHVIEVLAEQLDEAAIGKESTPS